MESLSVAKSMQELIDALTEQRFNMTVDELITKLQEMPQDLRVMIDDSDLGFVDIETVGRGAIYEDVDVIVLNYGVNDARP